jgi:glutaredoxin-like protein NrdH
MLSGAMPDELQKLAAAGFPTNPEVRYYIDRNRDLPVHGVGYELDWLRETLEVVSGSRYQDSGPRYRTEVVDQNDDGQLHELADALKLLLNDPERQPESTIDVTIYQPALTAYLAGLGTEKDTPMSNDIHPDAPQVILYSQPGCGPCIAVKRDLQKRAIPFVTVDIREDPNGAARVAELGYGGTPVTVAGDMHWHGFRKDKMQQLDDALRAWEPSAPIVD